MLDNITFNSPNPGPALLVLGAVHGNEPAGTLACRKLEEELHAGKRALLRGKLTLLPVCNPAAAEKNTRQIEENLNRVIRLTDKPQSYEQKLANEIAPQIAAADFTLDLHSSHCPGDLPFAFLDYPDLLAEKIIGRIPVEYVLTGWPEIYQANPAIKDYSTLWWAHQNNRAAVTVECGYHFAPEAADVAYRTIINTLQCLGMLAGTPQTVPQQKIKMVSYQLKEKEGRLAGNIRHFGPLITGQPLAAYDDGTKLFAPADSVMIMPNPDAAVGTEWYYLGIK